MTNVISCRVCMTKARLIRVDDNGGIHLFESEGWNNHISIVIFGEKGDRGKITTIRQLFDHKYVSWRIEIPNTCISLLFGHSGIVEDGITVNRCYYVSLR